MEDMKPGDIDPAIGNAFETPLLFLNFQQCLIYFLAKVYYFQAWKKCLGEKLGSCLNVKLPFQPNEKTREVMQKCVQQIAISAKPAIERCVAKQIKIEGWEFPEVKLFVLNKHPKKET